MKWRDHATHIHVVQIVTAEPSVMLRHALVNQDLWVFHLNVDLNVSRTANALQTGLVSILNVRILVLELVDKELFV